MLWRAVAVVGSVVVPLSTSAQNPPASSPGARLARDVAGDYVHFASTDTLLWLRIGGGGALTCMSPTRGCETRRLNRGDLKGGREFGAAMVRLPLAVGRWAVGRTFGPRHAECGRDLVRAQISATSWIYTLKYAVDRTRPNGDPRSFPSGHPSPTLHTWSMAARFC